MTKTDAILIVDDIDKNRAYMQNLLQSCLPSCKIDQAENGEVALQLVATRISQENMSYPLIIMDYQMPILNGAQATQQIRALEKTADIQQQSIIITWSAALTSPFPMADDCLPKYTNKQEIAAMLKCYGLSTN